MTEQRKLSLSLVCGLLLTIVLTIATFTVESQQAKCVLSWPACLIWHWMMPADRNEGTPADGFFFVIGLVVGFFIAATLYSLITLFVLSLTGCASKVTLWSDFMVKN
jgi:hypothetical protein